MSFFKIEGMGAETSPGAFDWSRPIGVPLPRRGPQNAAELETSGKDAFSDPVWGLKSVLKFHAQPSMLATAAIPVVGPFMVVQKFLEGGSSKASRTGTFNKALNDARGNVEQGLKVAVPAAEKALKAYAQSAAEFDRLSQMAEGSADPQVGEALTVVGDAFTVADAAVSEPIGAALQAISDAIIDFEAGADRINPNDLQNPALVALQELNSKLLPDLRKATASAQGPLRTLQQYLVSAKSLVERSMKAQKAAEAKALADARAEAQATVREAISYADEAVSRGEADTAFEILSDQTILDLATTANMVPTVQGRLESIRRAQAQQAQIKQMQEMLEMFRMYQAARAPGNFAPVSTNSALPAPAQNYAYPYPYYPPGYSTPQAAPSVLPLSANPTSLPAPYDYNDGTVVTLADGSRWRNGASSTWVQVGAATVVAAPGTGVSGLGFHDGNTSHFNLAELCSVWSNQ